MRKYYITEKRTWADFVHRFHPQDGSHYIDLPDGKILVAASFSDEGAEIEWENHNRVHCLPDPTLEGNTPLKAGEHVSLRHLFPEESRAKSPKEASYSEKTVLDVVKQAAKIHPGMRMKR